MPSDCPVGEIRRPRSRTTTASFGTGVNCVAVTIHRDEYGSIPLSVIRDNLSVDIGIDRSDTDCWSESDAEDIVLNLRSALVWLRKEKKREL